MTNEALAKKLLADLRQTRIALAFEFADQVDEFPATLDGQLVSLFGGAGHVVIDEPRMLVTSWMMKPGDQINWHWHSAEEYILVESGVLTVRVNGDEPIVLRGGQGTHVKAEARHFCTSEEGSRFFVVFEGEKRPSLRIS